MNLIILIIIGLCIGSFINAFVWRLHEGKDWINGRSECPKCHHQLKALDLIPIVSWFLLQGRCRYCHKPISIQYPLVELLTAILFVVSYKYWSLGFHGLGLFQFIMWLIILIGFLMLMIYDMKWLILPNKIIYPLIIIALSTVVVKAIWTKEYMPIVDSVWGIVFLSGLFYVLFQVSKGRWIGGGDVKLGILLGLLVGGPIDAILTLYLASILGSLYAAILVLKGKSGWRKARIAFGPFLITACIVVYLFGHNVTNWYLNIHL